jgi:hypothetical protein
MGGIEFNLFRPIYETNFYCKLSLQAPRPCVAA